MPNLLATARVAELRRLAEAAQASICGPWKYDGTNWRGEPTGDGWYVTGGHAADDEGRPHCTAVAIVPRNPTSHPVCERVAAHVAAADPATVLALCDAADRLREVEAGRAAEAENDLLVSLLCRIKEQPGIVLALCNVADRLREVEPRRCVETAVQRNDTSGG